METCTHGFFAHIFANALSEPKSLLARLFGKIEIDPTCGLWVTDEDGVGRWEPCWQWKGSLNDSGYGNFRVGDKVAKAHRTTFKLFRDADLSDELVLDHLCAYAGAGRKCCNPWHLDPVTQRENVFRGLSPVGANMRKAAK
jgi:hypothetical protein